MYKYNKKTLDNGLKIIAHKMPQMKSAALGIWIAAGGRYENMDNRGISHFTEHLLFKGTKKRTTVQIKNSIEGIGGVLNGFTSEEVTCYFTKVIGRHIGLGLDVLSDMVLNAKFDPKDVRMERSVILEEIKMYKDHPDQHVHELLAELLWPKQTLGIPLIGTFRTVHSLKRRDLIEYRNKFYNPSNITIAACGDVNWDIFLKNCEDTFLKKRAAGPLSFGKIEISQKAPKIKILGKATEQTNIAIGFHGIRRNDPARYAMDILNVALGANMSSRLFHELREKRGLAYAISSHVRYYADGGAAVISAGVDNKKISKAIQLIIRELSKIKKAPITKKEFERAKEYYLGYLSFLLEDTVDHMLWLGEKVVMGDKPFDAGEIFRGIKKVGIEDISKLAAGIFKKNNMDIAVIGPINNKEKKAIEDMAQEL